MNERIKELAEQAGNTLVYGPFGGVDVAFNTEKFAELLVRECIDTIVRDTANYPGEGMMAYYQGVQDAGKSIKHHFGVEE